MDTKISSDFWDDPDVIELDEQARLAALWLLTNARLNLAGYAEISGKVFSFQTGLSQEALARAHEGLPKTFLKFGKGYWVRNFIRRQIGQGNSLVRNNYLLPLLRDIQASPEPVVQAVLENYPELSESYKSKALGKDLGSTTQAPEKRRAEKNREEQSRAEQLAGGAGGRQRAAKPKAGATLPAEQPEPVRSRMLAIGALKHRETSTAWGANELEAFRAQRLDSLSEEDFTAQLAPLAGYYAAVIPREKDFRRRELLTLLNHWAGEIDKAKEWLRDNNDGLKRM
jgi:hypothetical protein